MTDVWLNSLTGALAATTGFAAGVALLGLRQAERDAREARQQQDLERAAGADERRRHFQAGVALAIARDLETWLAEYTSLDGRDQRWPCVQSMRAGLSALPVAELELLRYALGVFPSEHARVRWEGINDEVRKAKLRDEVTAYIHQLMQLGPQTHEPPRVSA